MKEDTRAAIDVLGEVAKRGYQKTSMQNIADAMEISRQALYKRYGAKEHCYEWAIHTYMAYNYQRMFLELSNYEDEPLDGLLNAFDIFIGESIELVNYEYGMKVFDDVLVATHASKEDWIIRFQGRMAEFLVLHKFVPAECAVGIAKVLISASKGALIEKKTKEQFSYDMKEMVQSVIYMKERKEK